MKHMKPTIIAALLAFGLSACGPTLDPLSKRSELESITTSLASATENWPAYQAGLSSNADALASLAADCSTPAASDSAELKAVCYGVSAEAYSRLTDLPSGSANLNGEPASLARGIADTAAPVCQGMESFASCQIIETVDATVGARRFASDLIDMSLDPATADAETAEVLFSAFADEVNSNWGSVPATGPARAFKLDQACYVSWAAGVLPLFSGDADARVRVEAAAREARASAAKALALSPCDDGGTECPRNIPCVNDPESAMCQDRRTFALTRYCGPGVPTPGGES